LAKHYGIDPDQASDFMNTQMTPEVKARTILRLYHGDTTALQEFVERIKFGNKY
jgi:hypothetical protein